MIDVIIVSWALDAKFKKMTQAAIDTCRLDKVNIIVVEQNKKVKYDVQTLHYDFEFGYHRCLNLGLKYCKNKYVALCNNDLLFRKDWAKNLVAILELGFDTVCPYCPKSHPQKGKEHGNYIYEGWEMGSDFIGWCIAGEVELFRELKLTEEIDFWYSDNLLNEQLRLLGKKHALVCNSIVEHLDIGTKTLRSLPHHQMEHYTRGQQPAYKEELRKLYAKRKRI